MHIVTGDCRDALAVLPAESVHCVVTSPPYWGLRDYGIAPTVWGRETGCAHVWGDEIIRRGPECALSQAELSAIREEEEERLGSYDEPPPKIEKPKAGARCRCCGAWCGAHGLEPTIDLYLRNAVEVFRAVRRVLRPDGTLWLNLGDSYAHGTTTNRKPSEANGKHGYWTSPHIVNRIDGSSDGLKTKDLCGVPWRVAFALQADGWYLRQDIIWHKPNPMPESTTDRCTKAHEYLFLLTKRTRYFFDAEAIKEDAIYADSGRSSATKNSLKANRKRNGNDGNAESFRAITAKRNKRSVWTVATAPFPEAHFATFPPKLIEPCIKAGTSEHGCCGACGAPWRRVTESKFIPQQDVSLERGVRGANGQKAMDESSGREGSLRGTTTAVTIGWRPSCACNANVVPCTVLDPFGGAGTTGLVCRHLQRKVILIEANPTYVEMARKRIQPYPWEF